MKIHKVLMLIYIFQASFCHGMLAKEKPAEQLLSYKENGFDDVHATIRQDASFTPESLENELVRSVDFWKKQKYKAIWFALPAQHAAHLSTLLKYKFILHHGTGDQIVLFRWLNENAENILPPFVPSLISVAALVIDENNNVLVVKERYGPERGFRLPGGGVNKGENLWQAAIREVKEETGIDTKFCKLVAFRHGGNFPFCMELLPKAYFCCLLSPLTTKIVKQASEIDDAQWLPYAEFKKVAKNIFADFLVAYEGGEPFIFNEAKGTTLYTFKS